MNNYNNNTTGKYEEAVKQAGLKAVTFSQEETDELNKLAESVREEWVKSNSKHFNAKELFEFTRALFNK